MEKYTNKYADRYTDKYTDENVYERKDRYKDASLAPEERAADLLGRMSLEEKMGQVSCLFAGYEDIESAAPYGIGQVSLLEMRRAESLGEAARWQRQMQEQIMEKSPHHIPAVFHMEGLCGAYIQGAVSFPSGIGRASSFDPELERQVAEVVSRQERAVGITQILAPVLDISRDSRMGRQGETYGEDPALAGAMGAAFTKGIQEGSTEGRKAEAAAKHFLGFHNSQGGIHGADCEIPDRLLEEVYAKPFQAAITEGNLRGVMPCYCAVNGEPVSVSKKLLTGLLREKMGFDGVTVSDYGAVGNVHSTQKMYESITEAGLHCMEAGMDVEMQSRTAYNAELEQWFREGRAEIGILDNAVYRILCAKFRMGLFENPYALTGESLEMEFYREEDQQISLQSALESFVLLKNDGTLPIGKKVKKIAVIGCHAGNARSFFGGYTHLSMAEAIHAVANSMAGVGTSGSTEGKSMLLVPGTNIQSDETDEFDAILRLQKPECLNLVEGLREALPETEIRYSYGYAIAGNDTSHFEEALKTAEEADLIILTLGGKHGSCSVASMGEGVDGTDINLPFCQDEFIRRAAALGKPMAGIHFNGRPISSDTADQYLNAILEAWNPSEMGAEALAEVLAGAVSPSGKMPVSVARNAGQIPVYYNHANGSAYHQGDSIGFKDYVDMPHTPRYFFGHGLTYTSFSYENMTLEKKETGPDESLEICVEIQNTGKAEGTEIVQLYLRDCYASKTRPVMELGGFARVSLKSGEKKKVIFTVHPSQMAFLDEDMEWKTEAGDIEVLIGASSQDIRCQDAFRITQSRRIDGKNRCFYSKVRQE